MCAILYERPKGKLWPPGVTHILKNLHGMSTSVYGLKRVRYVCGAFLVGVGSALLRFAHACPANPNGKKVFALADLVLWCERNRWSVLVTDDSHSSEAMEFVRKQSPDLGVVLGNNCLEHELLAIPRHGTMKIHRGAGRDCSAIQISVHLAAGKPNVDAVLCSATIPIRGYVSQQGIEQEAEHLGNDLLIQAVAECGDGPEKERGRKEGQGFVEMLPSQPAEQFRLQPPWRTHHRYRTRARWKLWLRVLVFGPLTVLRNWYRRFRGSFPVIILYHHLVSDRPHHLGIPTELFLRHVRFLHRHYRIVSLTEAMQMLSSGSVRAPTVALTFDDGYRDSFPALCAVVEETGVQPCLFVCSEIISEGREFDHDLRRGVRNFLPFTWSQLAYLAEQGCEIGSHTRSHFDCGSTELSRLQEEIRGSRLDLERHLGRGVRFFAFPLGGRENMSPIAVELARNTYKCIFSTWGGENFSRTGEEIWHLERCGHPNDLLELELALQSVLNRGWFMRRRSHRH